MFRYAMACKIKFIRRYYRSSNSRLSQYCIHLLGQHEREQELKFPVLNSLMRIYALWENSSNNFCSVLLKDEFLIFKLKHTNAN